MQEKKFPSGYGVMIAAMRNSEVDVPDVIDDIREYLRREIEVPPGVSLAAIDFLIETNEQLRNSIYGLRSALDSMMGVNCQE